MVEAHEHPECKIMLENLMERVKKIEDSEDRTNYIRDRIYERLEVLERKEAATSVEYGHILNRLDDMTKDIREIKDKPTKKYELIVTTIITAVIGTGIGALIMWFFSK